jgi:hypothetical protein
MIKKPTCILKDHCYLILLKTYRHDHCYAYSPFSPVLVPWAHQEQCHMKNRKHSIDNSLIKNGFYSFRQDCFIILTSKGLFFYNMWKMQTGLYLLLGDFLSNHTLSFHIPCIKYLVSSTTDYSVDSWVKSINWESMETQDESSPIWLVWQREVVWVCSFHKELYLGSI